MNSLKLPLWMNGLNGRALAAPILIILMLAMMVLPLPAFILDVFFSFNIAIAIIVLLTSLYTVKPLDFHGVPNSAAGQHYAAFIAQRRVYPRGVD
jgi:flagellar biosynthesis protein FlhA